MKLRVAPLALVSLLASVAHAAPATRQTFDLRGDFVVVGNTLAHDCRTGVPAPVVGTVGACGSDVSDGSPDIFWEADAPAVGVASTTSVIADARSTALLTIPAGATVTYARLYWAAEASAIDTSVSLERQGVFTDAVTADDSWNDPNGGLFYQATADVTSLVQMHGDGTYRVAGVDSVAITDLDKNVAFAAWSLVVVYELSSEPSRNITLFDGFDRVANGAPATASLSGFLVPNAGFDAKLGVIAYEGDDTLTGDNLRFGTAPLGATDRLSDALNPANNFFNGTRSALGAAVSNAGDLPQLTGAADSMSGVDIDVIDVTSRMTAGQTSVDIEANSAGDTYYLGGFVTSISTLKPDFATSDKTALDVNGGELVIGDELEYTITALNDGNDTAVDVVITDALPGGVTYVPGSLEILSGPGMGSLTDAVDTDQGEFDSGTVTVRVGAGADGSNGGSLAPGESTQIAFRVTVNDAGELSNQAQISASGLLGSPSESTPTDGSADPGSQETITTVHACGSAADCSGATPACDTEASPHECVECVDDGDCSASAPVCDTTTRTCGPCTSDDQCGAGQCVDGGCTGGQGGAGGGGGAGGTSSAGQGGSGQGGAGGALGGAGGAAEPIGRYAGSGFRCHVARDGSNDDTSHAWWLVGLGLWFARRRQRR